MCRNRSLLAEVIANLQSLVFVGDCDDGDVGRVNIHRARLVLELVNDSVEQVVDVAAERREINLPSDLCLTAALYVYRLPTYNLPTYDK